MTVINGTDHVGKTNKLFVFRMTHINNVPFILRNGLWSQLSAEHSATTPSANSMRDHDFHPIGNIEIIGRRTNKQVVVVPPGGVLGEYVPFYFSGHSPMLLNIATGYGVPRVPQKDIVFLVCDAFEIASHGLPFCFTDGNRRQAERRAKPAA